MAPPGCGEDAAFSHGHFCPCRVLKVPDHPEALCFRIRGAAPPYVYAVGRGELSRDAGLCVGGVEAPKPLPPGLGPIVAWSHGPGVRGLTGGEMED